MMRKLRPGLLILFIFLSAGLLWAGGEKEPRTFTGAVFAGPSGMAFIRLFEGPPDLGPGFDLRMIVLPTPADMAARAATGEVDFAVFPVNTAVKLYNAGPAYRLGAVTGLGTFFILSRDRGVTDWESLAGTTVYSTGKGATPDYLLKYFAEQQGVEITADFSHNNAAQLAQLALAGKVDTVLLPEPFVSMVLSGDPEMRAVIDFQDEWNRLKGTSTAYPVTLVTVKPETAEKYPEVVQAFLRACEQSIVWVAEHPREAGELIEKHGILKAQAAEAAIPKSNLVFLSASEARESLTAFLRVLLSYDPASLGGALPDEGFYFEE